MPGELSIGVRHVDRGDDTIAAIALGDEEILHQRVDHRCRIGKPGSLDQHTREGRNLPPQPLHEQVAQAAREVATDTAAEAARIEQDDVVVDLVDQVVVDADLAEFIDQHGSIRHRRLLQQVIEQRRLAGTEEAGEDGDRMVRLGSGAQALLQAREGSRAAGRGR